jgi:hypothetical protein
VKPTIAIALIAVTALACSARSINTAAPEAGQYAPANEVRADGEVSYLNAGAKRVRDARRADAYKKMHDHCGDSYEIIKEEDQEGALGTQRRIWFNCVSKASPQSQQWWSRRTDTPLARLSPSRAVPPNPSLQRTIQAHSRLYCR